MGRGGERNGSGAERGGQGMGMVTRFAGLIGLLIIKYSQIMKY